MSKKIENFPFKLNVGRMISQSKHLDTDLQETLDRNLSFLVTPLFHPNYPVDKQSTLLRNEPLSKPGL